jgi:hypothetical protein
MFEGDKYLTAGVDREIPIELQVFMWNCITNLSVEKDYLQVFELSSTETGLQKIIHRQEQPDYEKEYLIDMPFEAVETKIFVIDDGDHSTMLLAEEY